MSDGRAFFRLRGWCAALAVFLLTLSGCGPFWVDPYIAVKDSPLNWVEIHYCNLNRRPTRRIGLYLSGAGYAVLKKGTSELISNDFANRYQQETWDRIKTQRITVDTGRLHDIFQNLVNYGVLDHEKYGKASKEESFDRFIAVKANISNRTYSKQENIFEVDPDLAEQLLDVIREFDNPTL